MVKTIESFAAKMEDREELARAASDTDLALVRAKEDEEARPELVRIINQQREASHQGLSPSELFNDDESKLCHDFIEKMREQDFPNSRLLT